MDNVNFDKEKELIFNEAICKNMKGHYTGALDKVKEELDKIPSTNATAEVIDARGGKATLGEKVREISSDLENKADKILVNVLDFGAKNDANFYDEINKKYYTDSTKTVIAHDNRSSFQNAINYVNSLGGGTIIVPKGKYCFRGSVIWESNVSIKGDSLNTTIFLAEGVIFDLFKNTIGDSGGEDGNNPNVWLYDCNFQDFCCDLKGLTYEGENVSGKALYIFYMKRCRFNNLLLINTIGTALGCDFLDKTVITNVIVYNAGRNFGKGTIYGIGQSGIGIGTCSLEYETVVVNNCHVYNSGNYGIFVEQQTVGGIRSKGAKIINCHVENNKYGIGNKGSGAVQISNCTIINNTSHGVYLSESTKGDQITNTIIKGNIGDGVNIQYDYLGDLLISNSVISNNVGYGIRSLTKSTVYRDKITVTSNTIAENGKTGIYTGSNHTNFCITNNLIVNNGQLKDLSVGNNNGIYLYGTNFKYLTIANNTITGDKTLTIQKVGIEIPQPFQFYNISGNIVTGCTNENSYKISTLATNGIFSSNVNSIIDNKTVTHSLRKNIACESSIDASNSYRIVVTSIGGSSIINNMVGYIDGQEVFLLNATGNTITLKNSSGDLGQFKLINQIDLALKPYEGATFICLGTSWYIK